MTYSSRELGQTRLVPENTLKFQLSGDSVVLCRYGFVRGQRLFSGRTLQTEWRKGRGLLCAGELSDLFSVVQKTRRH